MNVYLPYWDCVLGVSIMLTRKKCGLEAWARIQAQPITAKA